MTEVRTSSHHGDPAPMLDAPGGTGAMERVAGQRLRLQLVATALAQSLDQRAVAAQVLEAACSVLGAPQGWVAAITSDGLAVEILHAIGYPEEVVAPWMHVPLDVPVPMTEAIRSGRPVYHRSAEDRQAEFPALAGRAGGASGSEGSAVVPLVFEGRVTGALAIAFHGQRDLDADERWFLESLASQASQGLERARLFSEVRERDERLQFALEASGTGTWEWDLERDRLSWSPEVSRIYGVPEGAEPPGFEAWLAVVHPDDRRRIVEGMDRSIGEGSIYDLEFRLVREDGSVRWVHSVGRPLLSADGKPVRMLGTSRDITDRRLIEAERDRVLEAEREAASLRDAFIGVVSHELRTPITTIYGGTRVLARRWRDMDPDTRDGILTDVVEEADRLYRLVEDLLVLTRVERGTLDVGDEPVHLGRVLERIVASERPRWPGVTFECFVPHGLPSVAAEETYVEQVMRNLIGNAAKYGGAGSRVKVTTSAEGADVVLRVLDEGPGIDEAEGDRLFELFYRSPATAAMVPGAGIGLFVCRQLVQAMGGRIHAERRPEGGAAFVVTLPRSDDDEPS